MQLDWDRNEKAQKLSDQHVGKFNLLHCGRCCVCFLYILTAFFYDCSFNVQHFLYILDIYQSFIGALASRNSDFLLLTCVSLLNWNETLIGTELFANYQCIRGPHIIRNAPQQCIQFVPQLFKTVIQLLQEAKIQCFCAHSEIWYLTCWWTTSPNESSLRNGLILMKIWLVTVALGLIVWFWLSFNIVSVCCLGSGLKRMAHVILCLSFCNYVCVQRLKLFW